MRFSQRKFFLFLLVEVFFMAAISVSAAENKEAPSVDEEAKVSTADEAVALKDAAYVGSETCTACHEKEAREFELSSHKRISVQGKNFEIQDCEMCNGPASLHVEAGGGKNNILNPKKDVDTCFKCHS